MVETAISIVGVFVGAGIAYGVLKAKIIHLEKEIEQAVEKGVFEQFEKRFNSLHAEVREINKKIDKLSWVTSKVRGDK